MTLTEFLLARIDEDEGEAREATPGPWRSSRPVDNMASVEGVTFAHDDPPCSIEDALHIARHNPARVLAECEAKRLVIREAHAAGADSMANGARIAVGATRRILRYLATPYADHPDYREEWRP